MRCFLLEKNQAFFKGVFLGYFGGLECLNADSADDADLRGFFKMYCEKIFLVTEK